ncbi:MAG: DMT family transporter [Clostridiales bacterium]|nr:DMT family transporter [Clostridiales bacterium]
MTKRSSAIGVLCAIGAQVLYGFSFLFSKQWSGRVSGFTLLSWRFLFAFVAMSLLALLRLLPIRLRGKKLLPLLLLAFFHPILYFLGEFFGVKLTTASESGTIISIIPIVTVLLSAWLLKEPPTKKQALGIGLSVCGVVALVLARGVTASFHILGYALLLGAVTAYSLFSIVSRSLTDTTPAEKTYIMSAVGALGFTLCAVVEHLRAGTFAAFAVLPFTNLDFLLCQLYLGVGCSVAGFIMSNYAISSIGPGRTTSFAGLTTLITVLAGVLLLSEPFSLLQGAATALVIGGVYLANASRKNVQTANCKLQ